MEIVLLGDVVASYGSLWCRVANTQGLSAIAIKDRFREQGFGEGAEELEVEGIDLSIVSGASRLFFRRAANNTKAEVHRLGSVMIQTNAPPAPLLITASNASTGGATYTNFGYTTNGSASQDERVTSAVKTSDEGTTEPLESPQAVKRGRGRPKGSKNRPKQPFGRVTVPNWPNV